MATLRLRLGIGLGLSLWLALNWTMVAPNRALAQTETLHLSIRRNVGYRSGDEIQGSMHLEITGPSDLVSVTYKIDGTPMGTVTTGAPFGLDFNTDDYPPGAHILQAEGQTATGQVLLSETAQLTFLSAAETTAKVDALFRNVVWPLFGLVGVLLVIALGFPVVLTLTNAKQQLPPGAPRKYGLLGGAICAKCHRPFSIHWWALNAGLQRYDRCDYCGRWSLVKAVSKAELAAAEQAEITSAEAAESAPSQTAKSAEEKLRELLEQSKYES